MCDQPGRNELLGVNLECDSPSWFWSISLYVFQTVRSYCRMLLPFWMKLPRFPYLSRKMNYISWAVSQRQPFVAGCLLFWSSWHKLESSFGVLPPLVWSVGQSVGYFLDWCGKSWPLVGTDIPGRWSSVVLESRLSKECVTSHWAVFSMVFASVPASRLVPWVPPPSSLSKGL